MKKLLKIISFFLVFAIIFCGFQKIYHYRWEENYERYVQFEKIPSVDVVFVGTSELWSGAVPLVLYEEEGITAFNLSHAYKASPTFYYEIEYIIKHNKPKCIAMDFSSLYTNTRPQNNEDVYRTALYSIPDNKIRAKLLFDTLKISREPSYLFPLLRFHSMWSTCEADFSKEYQYDDIVPNYMMGWENFSDKLWDPDLEKMNRQFSPDMWEVEEADKKISKMDQKYLGMIIDLARENDVKLIAVIPPKYSIAAEKSAEWKSTKKFFEENAIDYFDYNTYDSAVSCGLDWNNDFFDETHLNYKGAIKWSKILADDLSVLGFEDHRLESNDLAIQLNDWKNDFDSHYKKLMNN